MLFGKVVGNGRLDVDDANHPVLDDERHSQFGSDIGDTG